MKKCEEISELVGNISFEDVTKIYPNSLRLRFAAPHTDIYVAAGNYEEISKWKEVLSMYCKRVSAKADSSATTTSPPAPASLDSKATKSTNKLANFDDMDNMDDIDDIDAMDEELEELDGKNHAHEDAYYDEEYEDDVIDNVYEYGDVKQQNQRRVIW